MTRERIGHLDSIRGFAALYVVLFHLALVPNPAPDLPEWLRLFVMGGWSGVPMFFVLSAWTLVMMRDGRQYEDRPDARFLVRRWFRIVPLYYVWLAVMVFATYGFGARYFRREIAQYATFTYNLNPALVEGIVWASWTLGVEMLFYAAFPLIWRVTRTPKTAGGAVLVSMLLATGFAAAVWGGYLGGAKADQFLTLGIATALPAFACGIFAYRVHETITRTPWAPRVLWLVGSAAWLVAVLVGYAWATRAFVFPFAYGCLLLAITSTSPRLFYATVPRYLGRISYSLYLNHPPIVFALAPLNAVFNARFAPWTGLSFLIASLVAATALVGVSALTFRYIEEPGNAAGRWLLSRWRARPHAIHAARASAT